MAAPAKHSYDEVLLRQLEQLRAEHERNAFANPPKDYSQFMFLLGAWTQMTSLIESQKALHRELVHDDDEG